MKKIFLGVGILCILILLIGFGIKSSRDNELLAYKSDLKQYVEECGAFSEEEKIIVYIAIDHIEIPKTISNNRLISVYRLSQKYSNEDEIDLKSETGRTVNGNDWQVDIGDISTHKNFSAIIDGETMEFVMQIPIA